MQTLNLNCQPSGMVLSCLITACCNFLSIFSQNAAFDQLEITPNFFLVFLLWTYDQMLRLCRACWNKRVVEPRISSRGAKEGAGGGAGEGGVERCANTKSKTSCFYHAACLFLLCRKNRHKTGLIRISRCNHPDEIYHIPHVIEKTDRYD